MFNYIKKMIWGDQQVERKFGWIKDSYTEEHVKTRPALSTYRKFLYHPSLDSINVDLRNKCPPVYDQGQLGSCTANAICGAYEFEMIKQNEKYEQMSRLFLYYSERDMEGTVNSDAGAEIKDGVHIVETMGICEDKLWPYDITQFNVKPSDACYSDQKLHKAIKAERVQQTNKDLKQCLVDGYPIIFGFTVYDNMMSDQVKSTGMLTLPSPTDKILGGHAVLIVGYITINGTDHYVVRNSWGDAWGDKGYFYMPVEYVENSDLSSDFWSIKIVDDKDN